MTEQHRYGHGGNMYRYSPEEREKLTDFSANINPFGVSAVGIAACRDWERAIQHYPEPESRTATAAVAAFYDVPAEQVMLGNGATELLYLWFAEHKPPVLYVPAPTFSEYERAGIAAGAEIRYFSREDFATLPLRVQAGEAVCLCTPNNPTGELLSANELQRWATAAQAGQWHVLIDESFGDFVADFPSAKPYLAGNPYLHILQSLTKFWAVPGLRIGALFTTADTVQALRAKTDIWNVNVMASLYITAALTDRAYYERTRRFLQAEVKRVTALYRELPGWEVYPPTANFMLLRLPAPRLAAEFTQALARRGFLIRNCDNYPGLTAAHIRVAIRSAEENDALYAAICEEIRSIP